MTKSETSQCSLMIDDNRQKIKMFSGPKFVAYVQKPSVYSLRKLMPESRREELIKQITSSNKREAGKLVTNSNVVYRQAYELAKRENQAEYQKYQDSFLWSPRFTPSDFYFHALPAFIFAFGFILYHRYVILPGILLERKIKRGIRIEEFEQRGYLDGWYEEYIKPDKVLKFEAFTLEDMDKLSKEGLLAKTPEQTIDNIEKKKSKFIKGTQQFILEELQNVK